MRSIKQYLLVTLGFGLAGMIGAAFGTGTAQAVVATLVEIVNPTSSPVPTSSVNVTDPGRIAYQSGTNASGNCTGNSTCSLPLPTVPAGHRVVIQHIYGTIAFKTTPSFPALVEITCQGCVTFFFPYEFYAPLPSGPAALSLFDLPVLFYVDSGGSLSVGLDAGTSLLLTVSLGVTGYELDCTAAACAPIASQ